MILTNSYKVICLCYHILLKYNQKKFRYGYNGAGALNVFHAKNEIWHTKCSSFSVTRVPLTVPPDAKLSSNIKYCYYLIIYKFTEK